MSALLITYLILCLTQLTTSQSVDQFTVSTTAAHPGEDATTLIVTLYWENNSYTCSFTTSSTTLDEYNCHDQVPWTPIEIAQNNALPYYLQFKWMTDGNVPTSFIEIDAINVTLDNGFWYIIDRFCIHSKMACTLDLSSAQKCGQWSSKDEYNTFKMGNTTNFKLLYVDFRSDITSIPNFANMIHEGSVRPPNLVQLGVTTTQTYTADAVSAQWDNKYYRCADGMTFESSTGNFSCNITESKTCPGIESNYWWSIYNDATGNSEAIVINSVEVVDETGTSYRMSQWCHERDPPFFDNPPYPNCTELNTYVSVSGTIPVGGYTGIASYYNAKQVAFLAPDYGAQSSCIFAYPDVVLPNIEIGVLSAEDSREGWDIGQYGGITNIICPVTEKPTGYPTMQPTYDPTLDPTSDPTFEPTFIPTHDPTKDPTKDPTFEPTFQPTHDPTTDPTADPTHDPTFEPTFQPTHDPTVDPTRDPTFEPTFQPTHDPTKDPTADPTHDPTFEPTVQPTNIPTFDPTHDPTNDPTFDPTKNPTFIPTFLPTFVPTFQPTFFPTFHPTSDPTKDPTKDPTFVPTFQPTFQPTFFPTFHPTSDPTRDPTKDPTFVPTFVPTFHPTSDPTRDPTFVPTFFPTFFPTFYPTNDPTKDPTYDPTNDPTTDPSADPTFYPTNEPTLDPTTTTVEVVVDDRFILPYNIEWIEGIIAIGALLICCLLFGFGCCLYRRKRKASKEKVKTLGNITTGTSAEMTDTKKTTIVLTTEKENKLGFEEVQAQSPDVEAAEVDEINIKLEDSDEIKLEEAVVEGGDGGKSIDTINTMNTGDFIGSLDGIRDTGNKDDAALDLILDGAPAAIPIEHQESLKFTV